LAIQFEVPGKREALLGLALLGLTTFGRGGTPPLPVIPTNQYLITDYGAVGDGVSDNTAAIQSTIEAAGAAGGTVIVPAAGTLSTYLSGPFTLTNNLNLRIDSGATLKMFPIATFTNYPSGTNYFINATKLHDIEISGNGIIDGQGAAWWSAFNTNSALVRPKMINISGCTRVLVQDVTLQNPPMYHLVLRGGNVNVTVQRITINTPSPSPNTDGIQITATNVLVQNCSISGGDDNIALGSSSPSTADVVVSNCVFGTGHGVSIGSYTAGGVRDLTVSNCTFNGTDNGIRLKSDRDRGGLVENLRYLDISMTNVRYPIIIYSYYGSVGVPSSISALRASTDTVHQVTSKTPIWRNITISNLTVAATNGFIAGIIWGLPEMLVSNITFSKVNISASKSFDIYNARGIQFVDSQIHVPVSTNTLVLYNAQVTITNAVPGTNLVTLGGLAIPPTNNTLALFNTRATITESRVLGTGPITLGGSTLTLKQGSVDSSNNPISIIGASALSFTNGANSLSGSLTGAGPLTLDLPTGTLLTLRGDNSDFSGSLVVSNSGTLLVNNTIGSGTGTGPLTVLTTANLGGNGVIGGPVTVNGTLSPGGNGVGTLTISNNLTVNSGAILSCALGTSSDRTVVSGNLTLGGTLSLTDAGGFTNGTYTLFGYGGTFNYNGLNLSAAPAGYAYAISTATPGQVDLVVTATSIAYQQWQMKYFGSTFNLAAGPEADPDGDGQNNMAEFLSGTNPTNSLSALRIVSTARLTTDVVITWTTAGGRTNAVQAAAGGANGSYTTNNFTDLSSSATIIPGSGDATTNYVDVGGATNSPSRFYRIRLVP
jgi:hypothetical protein